MVVAADELEEVENVAQEMRVEDPVLDHQGCCGRIGEVVAFGEDVDESWIGMEGEGCGDFPVDWRGMVLSGQLCKPVIKFVLDCRQAMEIAKCDIKPCRIGDCHVVPHLIYFKEHSR